ncbi:hypothetical protein Tco_1032408 [Tanacetum coccineum]|uniref:Integrase, catalytic region, zinc finger, CCHC-type, peptidase aspartic, catalytic n=1 Tax=Tanacetum coccineum TaxID=301880 RepID=A0ABQ5GDV7_9ASTR
MRTFMKSITEGPFQMGTFIQTPAEETEGALQLAFINDIERNTEDMSRMQLNSKFVNNMLPEWSRFITEVKLNRGLKESNFDQLYAYLKQHEVHANENRMMMERFIQPTDDPLALVSYCNQIRRSTSTDNLIESLTNTLALLRTSSNARNKATVQDARGMCGGRNRVGKHESGVKLNPLCATTGKESGTLARGMSTTKAVFRIRLLQRQDVWKKGSLILMKMVDDLALNEAMSFEV